MVKCMEKERIITSRVLNVVLTNIYICISFEVMEMFTQVALYLLSFNLILLIKFSNIKPFKENQKTG
jgi:hypothetical protein